MLATLKRNALSGLTLVELMIVIAILGIVLAVATPSFIDLLNRRRVQLVATNISNDLAFARAESGLRPDNVIVYFKKTLTMSCYTIAYGKGQFGSCDCTQAPGSACNPALTSIRELKTEQVLDSSGVIFVATGDWPAWAANRFAFVAPQMLPTYSNVAITVTGTGGSKMRVQLNGMGRVQMCSPNGSFSGVPQC
nr:prepilin-type N-terminal cleavage/methylation domain-containing protein [uncultured Roseateles sp.]